MLLDKQEISVKFTCCFDSIAQILINAYIDFEEVKNYIDNTSGLPIFDFIKTATLTDNINPLAYTERYKILKSFIQLNYINNNTYELTCEKTSGDICKKLFQNLPAFTENRKCSAGCSNSTYKSVIAGVGRNDIKEDLERKVKEYFKADKEFCDKCFEPIKSLIVPGKNKHFIIIFLKIHICYANAKNVSYS